MHNDIFVINDTEFSYEIRVRHITDMRAPNISKAYPLVSFDIRILQRYIITASIFHIHV